MRIEIPQYMDSKRALRSVYSEAGYVHNAWEVDEGKVIVFEHIYDNYPAGSFGIFNTKEEYYKATEDIDWITTYDDDNKED